MDPELLVKVVSTKTAKILLTNHKITNFLILNPSNEVINGGSQPGKQSNLFCDHLRGYQRLYKDYFRKDPVYNNQLFRRHFCMKWSLFLNIVSKIEEEYSYLNQRSNAAGKIGLTGLQKITSEMQQLSYGTSADHINEYVRISETTSLKSLHLFCQELIEASETTYLRYPTEQEVQHLMEMGEKRGF
ncbi:hypothetical protein O181_068861 [Austropuccinia psidii MF-1]|uniref:Uncharacterized protein n=1 Tax=Austropuccinia psidii MF-1 TaxID=1389203 RepID=A0A9Q3F2E4_9BASI|nr:hypothetical protein [Austropuccinia psidii MF-1]